MNKLSAYLGVFFLLAMSAYAAIGVPTPSGKPELKVRLSDKVIESRLTQAWTATGWHLSTSDEWGFAFTKAYSGVTAGMLGEGGMRVRFNLVKAKGEEGVTQIRAVCALVVDGVETDESGSALGRDTQRSLEELFKKEAVDGPYMKVTID